MKLLSSELTFYTYLKVGPKEDWKKCVKSVVAKARKKGFVYSRTDSGSGASLKEPGDIYEDGSMGAALFFRALKKKNPV